MHSCCNEGAAVKSIFDAFFVASQPLVAPFGSIVAPPDLLMAPAAAPQTCTICFLDFFHSLPCDLLRLNLQYLCAGQVQQLCEITNV